MKLYLNGLKINLKTMEANLNEVANTDYIEGLIINTFKSAEDKQSELRDKHKVEKSIYKLIKVK